MAAAFGAFTGEDDRETVPPLPFEQAGGLDQDAVTLALAQAARQQHDLLVRGDLPGVPETPHPGGIDRAG